MSLKAWIEKYPDRHREASAKGGRASHRWDDCPRPIPPKKVRQDTSVTFRCASDLLIQVDLLIGAASRARFVRDAVAEKVQREASHLQSA